MTWDAPRKTHVVAVACVALATIAWAYWPGLSGPFLFDDFTNLDELGAFGPMDDWRSFVFYLTSGTADPTGRPVALLSFLIDGQDWPTDPWPFKRTNLVLHLVNTALLGWVVARLQAAAVGFAPARRVSAWTPWLSAWLWGAHPFFVSTTLYVVQREAMLPMTSVLLALLAWDRAVSRFDDDRRLSGWLWAILGFGGCTLLGGFSKANGLLAPLLAGLAHLWLLRPASAGRRWRAGDTAAIVCLGVPSLLIVGYVVQHGIGLWSQPYLPGRDWTIVERLLTQPRALWDYVWHLALPRAGGGGLFVDSFAVSRGWLDPASTLPAMLAIVASAVAAVALRRRFPIASFAWLFYLAAHLFESSVFALELYFEHRNYLPAAFLGWPVAHLLLKPGAHRRLRTGAAGLLLMVLLVLTHQRATTWGDAELLTALTAAHQQDSIRSQVAEARREIEAGDVAGGLARIRTLQRDNPRSVDVALNAIGLECQGTGALSADTLARARAAARTTSTWTFGMNTWLQSAASARVTRRCAGFGVDGLRSLVDAAEANPHNQAAQRMRDLWHIRGRIALAENRPDAALRWFNASLHLMPDPDYALVQAAILGSAGAQALGVAHLDFYSTVAEPQPIRIRGMQGLHRWLLRHYGYYESEISGLRKRLQADAGEAGRPDGD